MITSESVSPGHPDKIADQISDAILDMCISTSPKVHTAIETLVTSQKIIVAGEISGCLINKEHIDLTIRKIIKELGYVNGIFNFNDVEIRTLFNEQSKDIILGVNASKFKDEGAGDQGIMYGYATKETECLLPAPIFYSHLILRNIFQAVENGSIPKLGPDAKAQVTLHYEGNVPIRAINITVSIQHQDGMCQQDVRDIIYPLVVSSLPDGWMCSDNDFFVNPTGRFVVGGPVGDCGLTGRKIMVDTYGGFIPHGGGAFSGKDPSKVDRSAAYMARYLAKNIVSSGLAEQCLVQLSYAIGITQPLTFYINTYGTGKIDDLKIEKFIRDNIDLSPRGIREYLDLAKPIYRNTACYGHFGRKPGDDGSFNWEKENLSFELCREFNTNRHCKKNNNYVDILSK